MSKHKTFKIIGLCFVAALSVALGGYVLYTGLNPLQFRSEPLRQATTNRVLRDRKNVIEQLESIVTSTVNDPAKAETTRSAMLLLGQLHAEEAVPLLVDHLTFSVPRPHSFSTREDLIADIRPPLAALDSIGLPALPPLMAKQMSTDDPVVTDLTFGVLIEMLGARVSLTYVQEAVDSQRDVTKRRRLIVLRNKLSDITSFASSFLSTVNRKMFLLKLFLEIRISMLAWYNLYVTPVKCGNRVQNSI